MSTGVPKTMVVLMKDKVPCGVTRRNGTTTSAVSVPLTKLASSPVGGPIALQLA